MDKNSYDSKYQNNSQRKRTRERSEEKTEETQSVFQTIFSEIYQQLSISCQQLCKNTSNEVQQQTKPVKTSGIKNMNGQTISEEQINLIKMQSLNSMRANLNQFEQVEVPQHKYSD